MKAVPGIARFELAGGRLLAYQLAVSPRRGIRSINTRAHHCMSFTHPMNVSTRRDFLRTGTALLGLGGLAAAAEPPATGPYADAKFVAGPPPLPGSGAFTIVALPDTQNYQGKFAAGFAAQTRWIVEQKVARNIACVLHLGDITNNNLPAQWDNAARAMKLLDGHVPYFMAPGNHDYGKGGSTADRTSLFGEYFPAAVLAKAPTFGGFYDKEPERVENSFHLFSAGDRKFIVLCLEFGPRKDVVRWANDVVGRHQDREAILVTHAYLYSDDTRYDLAKFGAKQNWNPHTYGMAKASGGDACDGEELWNLLVSKHRNFIFTINGHVLNDGLGRLTSTAADNRAVPQLLVNFQMKPNGGDGWLRLLECRPGGELQVYDYSPTRNQTNASAQNQFGVALAGLKA